MLATLELSLAAKESMKTGLAMAIACGAAMAMGWSNPYWACIAVAVVSLPSVGESLMKCLHRLWGTLVGGLAALMLLALFPQERWAFLFFLSLYVGLCAYKITLGRYVYIWFLSGYVCLLIASSIIGTTSQVAFNTAVLRLQETALGVLVHTAVWVFVWPQRSVKDLNGAVKSLIGAQMKILGNSFLLLQGRERDAPPGTWLDASDLLIGQLRPRLAASELEQFQVREKRDWWRCLVGALQAMTNESRGWRESAPDLAGLDMLALAPGLAAFHEALTHRMAALLSLLDGRPSPPSPSSVPRLSVDQEKLVPLTPLQRVAVLNTVEAFHRLDAATRTLHECVLAITGESRSKPGPEAGAAPAPGPKPDRDSYVALARAVAAMWFSSLVWILVDPPGHMAYVVFVGLFVLMGILAPQMDWAQFFLVNMVGVVIAGVIYVLVMPQLSQFWQLAAVMFLLVAFISYISWNPRLAALKLAGIVPFVMMTNLQNRQAYDFALFLNNSGAMAFAIITVALAFHMPFGRRPERMFTRLVARFFRQAEACMNDLVSDDAKRRRRARAGLASLQTQVGRIGGWANRIDFSEVTAATPRDVSRLVAGLSATVSGLAMIARLRPEGSAPWPGSEKDMQALHAEILSTLRALGQGSGPDCPNAQPSAVPAEGHGPGGLGALPGERRDPADSNTLPGATPDGPAREGKAVTGARPERAGADARGEHHTAGAATFEWRLERAFHAVCARASDDEQRGFHRLLGGYRGLRRALCGCAELSAGFDWDRWNETRF